MNHFTTVMRSSDGFQRATPESTGIASGRVQAFLDDVADGGHELHSFMLLRNDAVIAEQYWWPFNPDRLHSVHSATKSFTTTAIGMAIAEGLFTLKSTVASFFPTRLPPDASPNLMAMTVKDLLTQTTGHDRGVSGASWRALRTSWIDEFLAIPVAHEPGTHFAYSSAGSFMLSAIISQVTGLSLADYLEPRLFKPLGMHNTRWDVGPEGINPGGNGLSCTTPDLLKLGVLYLNGGQWKGEQILEREWAEAATQDAHGNHYGYHWWIGPKNNSFVAFGAFGQYVFVFPEQRTVLVLTGAVEGIEGTALEPIVWKHFPDVLASPLAGTTPKSDETKPRVLPPVVYSSSELARHVSGAYILGENADGISAIELQFGEDGCRFTLHDERGTHHVDVGLRDWIESTTTMSGASLHHGYEPEQWVVMAAGRWLTPTQFEMTWQFVESPFRDTVNIQFDGATAIMNRSVNVNAGPHSRPTVCGTRIPL